MLVDDIQLLAKHKQQWGVKTSLTDSWTYYPIPFTSTVYGILGQQTAARVTAHAYFDDVDLIKFHYKVTQYDTYPTFQTQAAGWFLAYGKQQWGVVAKSDTSGSYTFVPPVAVSNVLVATSAIKGWNNTANNFCWHCVGTTSGPNDIVVTWNCYENRTRISYVGYIALCI